MDENVQFGIVHTISNDGLDDCLMVVHHGVCMS